VERSTRQQVHIDASPQVIWDLVGDPNRHPEWWPRMVEVECADLASGCRYRGVVKGMFGADEHDMLIERLEGCDEISIFCEGTGVTTRFVLTEARGGTFVEGHFMIEPNSVGWKVVAAVSGRRFLRGWLEQSLENLKRAAERAPAALP
jgi:uncharacterized protein YndB with AHSA1/START domain